MDTSESVKILAFSIKIHGKKWSSLIKFSLIYHWSKMLLKINNLCLQRVDGDGNFVKFNWTEFLKFLKVMNNFKNSVCTWLNVNQRQRTSNNVSSRRKSLSNLQNKNVDERMKNPSRSYSALTERNRIYIWQNQNKSKIVTTTYIETVEKYEYNRIML